jgi:hypothetical protein
MNTIRFLLLIIVALLCGARFAIGQCDHISTKMSRFQSDRYFPIIARNYDGSRIEWTYSDMEGNYAGTLSIDKQTKLPLNFSASYKNRYFWAIVSTCDNYAYAIYQMSPEQEKEFNKNPK